MEGVDCRFICIVHQCRAPCLKRHTAGETGGTTLGRAAHDIPTKLNFQHALTKVFSKTIYYAVVKTIKRVMAELRQLLANSLARLERFHRAGQYVFASSDLPGADRRRLIDAGYLTSVIRGWYLTSRPGEAAGDTTYWYANWKESAFPDSSMKRKPTAARRTWPATRAAVRHGATR